MDFIQVLSRFLAESSNRLNLDASKNLFIQSNMGYFFRQPLGRENFTLLNRNPLHSLKAMLQNYVEDSGVLFFPGFFDEYSKKNIPFDVKTSQPSKHIGAFPRYIFKSEQILRELNPLTNVIAIGPNKDKFFKSNIITTTGYAENSVWAQFAECSVGNLLIGIPPTYLTYLHFLEVQMRAPYIFNKIFDLPILNSGVRVSDFSICPVRFRDSTIQWNFLDFIGLCQKEGAIYFLSGSKGLVSLANPQRIKLLFEEQFHKNPFFLLKTEIASYKNLQNKLELSLDMAAPGNAHSSILS